MRPQTFEMIVARSGSDSGYLSQGVVSDGMKHKTATGLGHSTFRSLSLGTGSESTPFTTTNEHLARRPTNIVYSHPFDTYRKLET